MISEVKKHWPVLILAIILGSLMVLPFFYFQTMLGHEYKGILNQVIDDELFYMARIKDVMDGYPTLGNAYLLEHKNQLPQQLFLPEFLLAQRLKFLNLDIVQGRIFYSFVLPALILILTYLAFYLIYPSKFWANLSTVFLIFGLYLFKFTRPVIPQFVFVFWLSQFILLWLLVKDCRSKWIIPLSIVNFGLLFYLYPFYWTFYLVFLSVLILIYFFKDPEGVASRPYGVGPERSREGSSRTKQDAEHVRGFVRDSQRAPVEIPAEAGGGNEDSLSLTGRASASYGAGKLLSKQFLKIIIGGLIIGSFYFYITFLTGQLPEYQETLTRIQLVFSHSPSEFKTVLPAFLVLILFGILHRFKFIKINKEILFFISGIISVLLVTNQNVITGQKFEFGHYRMPSVFFLAFAVYYLLVPYEIARARPVRDKESLIPAPASAGISNGARSVTLFRMGWSQVKSFPPTARSRPFGAENFKLKFLFVSLMIIASAYGAYGYTQRVFKVSEQDIYTQKYAAIFDWLNKNTPPDSVVYANEEISGKIPVYTSNNVFYSRYANLFIMPDKEVEERFIINNFFEEFDKDFVIKNERAIWGVRYIDRYGDAVQANKWRKLLNLKLKNEARLPENEIERILTKAGEIQKNQFDESLKKYRVDYFIWDKNKNQNWKPEKLKLKPAYNFENIYVFEI